MADTDDKEDGPGEAPAAPKKSRKKLIIIAAAAVLLLIVGGGASWFLFFRGHGEEMHAEAAPKAPIFLDVPEVLVNLVGAPGERIQYLKVKVVLEVREEKQVETIKPTMPRVSDIFQTYMRELRPADLNGSAGLFRLKEELTRRVNVAIAPSQVNAVLFKEVVIQ